MQLSSGTEVGRNVGAAEFQTAVIERSRSVPVVVDFWAPWCGPCRVLGPVLEREVAALGGRVELVKVDTDQNPELAQALGVSSIPDVKALRDGRVVSEFVGAQPAERIRRWLAALAPSEAVRTFERAQRLLAERKPADAEPLLRGLLDAPEVRDVARAALARVLLDLGSAEEVPALLDEIDPRSESADRVPGLSRRLQFAADARDAGGEQPARAALERDAGDLEARWALASALAARADWAGALEQFLDIVTRSRKFRDDGARLAMLAIFDQLDQEDQIDQLEQLEETDQLVQLGGSDLAREFRRRLQIVT